MTAKYTKLAAVTMFVFCFICVNKLYAESTNGDMLIADSSSAEYGKSIFLNDLSPHIKNKMADKKELTNINKPQTIKLDIENVRQELTKNAEAKASINKTLPVKLNINNIQKNLIENAELKAEQQAENSKNKNLYNLNNNLNDKLINNLKIENTEKKPLPDNKENLNIRKEIYIKNQEQTESIPADYIQNTAIQETTEINKPEEETEETKIFDIRNDILNQPQQNYLEEQPAEEFVDVIDNNVQEINETTEKTENINIKEDIEIKKPEEKDINPEPKTLDIKNDILNQPHQNYLEEQPAEEFVDVIDNNVQEINETTEKTENINIEEKIEINNSEEEVKQETKVFDIRNDILNQPQQNYFYEIPVKKPVNVINKNIEEINEQNENTNIVPVKNIEIKKEKINKKNQKEVIDKEIKPLVENTDVNNKETVNSSEKDQKDYLNSLTIDEHPKKMKKIKIKEIKAPEKNITEQKSEKTDKIEIQQTNNNENNTIETKSEKITETETDSDLKPQKIKKKYKRSNVTVVGEKKYIQGSNIPTHSYLDDYNDNEYDFDYNFDF